MLLEEGVLEEEVGEAGIVRGVGRLVILLGCRVGRGGDRDRDGLS